MMPMVEKIFAGNQRAIGRAITAIENEAPERQEILKLLYLHRKPAYLLGITGSPGTGKSTLTDRLIDILRQNGKKVGVIAVDPTSPYTGGAILGDRVRMQRHFLDPDVFIRSMGTRGSAGGLSRATEEAVLVLEAAGKDVVIIETVGVGQSELDIMHLADSTVVVLSPGAGDLVQAFKAGIMEIADVFVVNKADLPDADKTVRQVEAMLDSVYHDKPWRPPVVKTVSVKNEGLDRLWEQLQAHARYLEESGLRESKRKKRIREKIMQLVHDRINERVRAKIMATDRLHEWVREAEAGKTDPYTSAERIMNMITV
ncbi:methylmalonyl Co-A mutase-associated GTPase MeaB [Bacillaceae bacterium]